jgi:hypothetical protein
LQTSTFTQKNNNLSGCAIWRPYLEFRLGLFFCYLFLF